MRWFDRDLQEIIKKENVEFFKRAELRAEEEAMPISCGPDERRNAPEMVLTVIGTNGQSRRILFQNSAGPEQCIGFGTFRVHFEIGRRKVPTNFIKRNGFHLHRATAHKGGFVPHGIEMNNLPSGAHGLSMKLNLPRLVRRKAGHVLF